jgi:hypothetical protein
MSFSLKDDCLTVALRVRSVEQVFDLRDPAPFREKDLDDEFARYLSLAIRSHPQAEKVHLDVSTPSTQHQLFSATDLKLAIREYFTFEVRSATQELQALLSEGRTSLIVGLVFLIIAESIAYALPAQGGVVIAALKQGLTVIGWVALWKPVNTFLYEWWPVVKRRKLLRILATARVQLIPGAGNMPTPPLTEQLQEV